MLLLLVGRAVSCLDALPRGTYDSRGLIHISIRSILFGVGAYLDDIVNGSLGAKGGIQAAHWFPGVGIFNPSFFTQDVLYASPAVAFAAWTWVGMHTLNDNARFGHWSPAFAAVPSSIGVAFLAALSPLLLTGVLRLDSAATTFALPVAGQSDEAVN